MTGPKWAAQGEMLDELISERGFERAELGRRLGLSADVMSNLCVGRTQLKGARRGMLALALGLSDEELRVKLSRANRAATKQPEKWDRVNVKGKIIVIPMGMSPIPVFSSVPAGPAAASFSDAEDVEFMEDWDPGFRRWGRFVDGPSMEEEFRDGDIVIFEDREAQIDQAVHATKDGEDCFKILRGKPGALEFWPLNPDFASFSAKDWIIQGAIVRRVRTTPEGDREVKDYRTNRRFRARSF